MSNNDDQLNENNLITELINYGNKGPNWKVISASSSGHSVIVHGLLSLANAIFPGARYLIIKDDKNGANHYIDLIRTISFSGDTRPEFTCAEVESNGKKLIVFTIFDSRNKPFRTDVNIIDSDGVLFSEVIYSHQTYSNSSKFIEASFHQTEEIWKDRFGIGPSPKDYVVRFLNDRQLWQVTGSGSWAYKLCPQFSMTLSKAEVTGGVYWWTEQFSGLTVRRLMRLRFGRQIISTVPLLEFKDKNLTVPFPDFDEVFSPRKNKVINFCCDIFYFVKGSIKYSLLLNLLGERCEEIVAKITQNGSKDKGKTFPIITFEDESEKKFFLRHLERLLDKFEIYLKFAILETPPSENDALAKERLFTIWAYQQYLSWRETINEF